MATGTVKWFNAIKGYGFIQPESGGKDVFVHISAVEKAGFTGLAEGAKISYEIVSDRGKEFCGKSADRLSSARRFQRAVFPYRRVARLTYSASKCSASNFKFTT